MSEKNRLPFFLNIAPMLMDHADEIVEDAAKMYESGAITANAFILTLTPEGDPVTDKGTILAERFRMFHDKLRKISACPDGILIQATIGHGWAPNAPTPWTKVIDIENKEVYKFCPLGKEFQAYIRDAVRKIAGTHPDFYMVDDDFRLITGFDGCYCHLHRAEYEKITGEKLSSEEMAQKVLSDDRTARIYDGILKESLMKTARIIRDALNEADPGKECSFCQCARDGRHAMDIARIFAAPSENVMVRINNGRYLGSSQPLNLFSELIQKTALQVQELPEDFTLLCEPDTFPHNRYSVSASALNQHVITSFLEGCRGAKLWLTRTGVYEPASGRPFRKVLAENMPLYRTLCRMEIQWDGPAAPLPSKPFFNFPYNGSRARHPEKSWGSLFTTLGLPFRFSAGVRKGILCLGEEECKALDDGELKEILCGNVLLDGSAAKNLAARGFSSCIGAEAEKWGTLPSVSVERGEGFGKIPFSAGLDQALLRPGKETKVLSTLFHKVSGVSSDEEPEAPGSILYTRPDGTKCITLALPLLPYGITAFAFLNETRKRQLLALLRMLGTVPVWYPGDLPVYLKTGVSEGKRIAAVLNNSADSEDRLELGTEENFAKAELLTGSGEWKAVPFTRQDSILRLELPFTAQQYRILRFS